MGAEVLDKVCFAVDELDDEVFTKFLFGSNPLQHFLSLIDMYNYPDDDNLRSVKQMEKVMLITKLLEGLGFGHVVDTERHVEHEAFMTNWCCNIFDDPTFRRHKRINELFNLNKSSQTTKDMTPRRVQHWVNRVLEPFSLKVVLEREGYRLVLLNDVLGILKRRSERGQTFFDGKHLLRRAIGDGIVDAGDIEITIEED